jgi:hypothetical protein
VDAVILGFAETFGQRPQATVLEQLEQAAGAIEGGRG